MTDVAISDLPALTPVPSTAVLPVDDGTTTSKATVANVVKGGGALLADGTVAATANLPMGAHKITGLQNGSTGTQDAATVAQTEALISAAISTIADWKQSVRFATTAALAVSTRVSNVRTANANGAFPTVDAVVAQVGDRLLDKNNATGADRGIWTITSLGSGGTPWVLTRAADADTSAEVTTGLAVAIEEGTANAGHVFLLTAAAPFTLNTSSWTFVDLGQIAGDGTTIQISAGVASIVALGVGTAQLAGDGVTFAKIQNIATDSLIGRDTAGTGDPENIGLDAATLQMDGAGNLRVPSQLGARGGENVIIDLYPSTQTQGTLATAASVNFDIAVPAGKRAKITADIWVDNGAGGACLYTKELSIKAHITGGVAVKVSDVTGSAPLEGAGFTFTAAANSTNIRFTLSNTSGSTRSYNIAVGAWSMDTP